MRSFTWWTVAVTVGLAVVIVALIAMPFDRRIEAPRPA